MSSSVLLGFLAVLAVGFASRIRDNRADVSTLIAVAQVHRHGQRTPVSFYTNDPYSDDSYWPCASGQLTNTGKQQHFELGRFTRQRYSGFLSDSYDPDEFYAQTTNVDRTHMSGQCNIAGIFRPRGDQVWNDQVDWQPIPLHASDSSVISTGPSCAVYWAELANVIVNDEEYKIINEKYKDLYAYLSENSGGNVTSVSGVDGIFDGVLIEDQFGYKLPEWVQSVYPEPIRTLSGYYFKAFGFTTLQKRLAAGNFLYAISQYFSEMFADPTCEEKYRLYSAHDTNIASILSTLGSYWGTAPPFFASTIYFELHNKSGVATVNIWHKDQDTWERLTVWGSDYDITLDEFNSRLSDYLVNSTAWTEECNKSSSDLTDLSTIQESPEVLNELLNVLEHANNRRHAKDQLELDIAWK